MFEFRPQSVQVECSSKFITFLHHIGMSIAIFNSNDPPASHGWVVWVSRPPVADGFFLSWDIGARFGGTTKA